VDHGFEYDESTLDVDTQMINQTTNPQRPSQLKKQRGRHLHDVRDHHSGMQPGIAVARATHPKRWGSSGALDDEMHTGGSKFHGSKLSSSKLSSGGRNIHGNKGSGKFSGVSQSTSPKWRSSDFMHPGRGGSKRGSGGVSDRFSDRFSKSLSPTGPQSPNGLPHLGLSVDGTLELPSLRAQEKYNWLRSGH
jgi:hypothetical protein